jgi:hypothetical protein
MSTPAWKKKLREEEQRKAKLSKEDMELLRPVKPKSKKFVELKSPTAYRREVQNYPSKEILPHESISKESTKYTGDYLIGIATSHKSNLIPVSKGEDPVAYAQMRRN